MRSKRCSGNGSRWRAGAGALAILVAATPVAAQEAGGEESDSAILALYDGLRVADIADGMDKVGLRDVGLVDPRVAGRRIGLHSPDRCGGMPAELGVGLD